MPLSRWPSFGERRSGISHAHTITEMANGAMISPSRYAEAWVKVMGDGHGPDRWESIVCVCTGHITYATDQPALVAEQFSWGCTR